MNEHRAQALKDAIAAIEKVPVARKKSRDTGRDGAAKEGIQTGLILAASIVRGLLVKTEAQ